MSQLHNFRATAKINAGALRHNLKLVRKFAPQSNVIAVVKANAYGHGLTPVCQTIAMQVDAFAVATIDEGIACRTVTPRLPVLLLSGLQCAADLNECAWHDLQPVVHCDEHLHWLRQYGGAALAVWLKVDTGMNRLGIAAAADAAAAVRENPRVKLAGVMSHLACADDAEDATTMRQLRVFRAASDEVNAPRSLANSAGIMQWPATHFDWVRPGIMLYGGSPLLGKTAAELGLRAVMQVEARLLAVKEVKAGQAVGYGGAFTAAADMRIGIVGFGYADGYPRLPSADARVLIGGARAPVVGRVAMDMLTVDLIDCPHAAVGDTVVLWGDGLSVDEVAGWGGTIAHDLLCRVGERVRRVVDKVE